MNLNQLDYAEEAESAERGNAWPQAAELGKRAAATCDDDELTERYREAAERCDARAAEGGA